MSTAEPEQTETSKAPEPGGSEEPPRQRASRLDFLPSPVFIALLGIAGLGGWLSWTRNEYGPFVLIMAGWLISLALHEYAHAALAYRFGDRALRGRGYLSLNPFKYSSLFAGLLMPVLFLLVGHVGLPGPAVYLDRSAVPGKGKRTLVALAGPAVNLVLAVALGGAVATALSGRNTDSWFWTSLLFLMYLQFMAALVNLLPIPGLDGFNAIAPYLPEKLVERAEGGAVFGAVAVFAVLWFPPISSVLLNQTYILFSSIGLSPVFLSYAQLIFTFWAN